MDLELALERALAYEYILFNPAKIKMHRTNSRQLSIPGLLAPHYLVDFESVILGNCVDYTVSMCNYGPNPAIIKLLETPRNNTNKSENKGKNRNWKKLAIYSFFKRFFI